MLHQKSLVSLVDWNYFDVFMFPLPFVFFSFSIGVLPQSTQNFMMARCSVLYADVAFFGVLKACSGSNII